MNDTISIKEAAEKFGISEQAVYKRLNTTFKPYVEQRLNNRGKPQKRLKISILDDAKDLGFNNRLTTVEQPLNEPQKPPQESSENASEAVSVAFLEKMLSDKDAEIKRLVKQLEDTERRTERRIEKLLEDKKKELDAKDEQIHELHVLLDRQINANLQLPAYQEQPSDAGQSESITQPQDQPKGFLAWWHNFWNGTTPTK